MATTIESVKNRISGSRAGFSLMEALIVVIILGVVGSMAVPGIAKSMTTHRVDRASQSVANEVEAAFSLAARERKPVKLVVDASRFRISIVDRATNATLQQTSFGLAESEYGLTRLLASPTNITIFPNGLASGSFLIYTGANKDRRVVVVSRTGQIRVTMP